MGLFKTPMPVAPGLKSKPSPARESDTISRLGETSGLLERLIRLLAPFQPRLITDANGFKYNVLAQDVGRGPVGTRYHVVTLDDVIPEPLSLVAGLVEDITPTVLAAIPASASIASLITSSLVDAATNGTSPSSVVSSVEALFTAAISVLDDIPDLVTSKLGEYSPIATVLEAKFSDAGAPAPRNGDYICTSALGIVYTLVQEQDGFPSNNSIFSVPFTYGTESWYAISLLPVPDIGGIVEKVTNLILQLLKQLIAASVNAAVEAVGAALVALFGVIDGIMDTLVDILAELAALAALLENITEVTAIAGNGDVNTLTVLASEPVGDNRAKDITWIASSDGIGKKAKLLVIGPDPVDNVEDVTWKNIDWIAQDGTMMVAQILTYINEPYEYPKEQTLEGAMEEVTVSTCDDDEMTILKKSSEA